MFVGMKQEIYLFENEREVSTTKFGRMAMN